MSDQPPLAPKRRSRKKSPLHLQDPWRWLENPKNPETLAYLEAENTYYDRVMQPLEPLAEELYQELKQRVAEDDSSVPEQDGEYWYYSRYIKDQQYPIFCRKKGSLEASEEIYLDQNLLAHGRDYCELAFIDITSDHRYCAFGIDYEGDERYRIQIKDLTTGEILADTIERVSSCFEWKDHKGFFYVQLDELDRPHSIRYHALGSKVSTDPIVYSEKDPSFFIGLDASEDDAYIFITCHGYDSSETYFHATEATDISFHLVRARQPGHEYDVTHHRQRFVIMSNEGAENNRLVWAFPQAPAAWHELLPHDPEVLLEGLVVLEKFWILGERYLGKPRLRILPQDEQEPFWIEYPESAYELNAAASRDFSSESFRFWYSSPKEPQTLWDMHVPTRTQTLLKRRTFAERPLDPELYRVERLMAKARDGSSIPVTLIYRHDLRRSGPQALLLHGYGSYGEIIDCDFSSYRLSLVDRGFIYALAHVRGGMDLGRRWYTQGKLEHKWNSFYDFIDVTEFLIQTHWTRPKFIVAEGSSAGGLLMGVVANERPDLYLGVVAAVPFVDVLNTMLDPELPLTTLEYHEWGHPHDPKAYARIKSYSPYDNVKAQDYPHMLVVTGLHDRRVMYWEAAKWVAKLRTLKTDTNLLLLKTEMSAGHGGASGRYDALREAAAELCFIVMLKQRFIDPELSASP